MRKKTAATHTKEPTPDKESALNKTVTLVIHGTFANAADWWRLGSKGQVTFADRLERKLARRGLKGTVWKSALREGFDYSSFSWSGGNRHRDRLAGARRLSSSLNQLAEREQATPAEPLTVNFVAHSHGGNVVLEALRHLKPNVRVGRIAMLGTPLVTVRPAFRIARFIFSTILLALLFLCLMLVFIELGSVLFTGHFFEAEGPVVKEGKVVLETVRGGSFLLIFIPVLLAYGWIFWMFGNLLDVTWRVICRLLQPLAWLRGKSSSLVYGPSPGNLETCLGKNPILLLTTHNDEADVLLQVTSSPARLYREYVQTKFSKTGRTLEFIFLRPFVLGVFLKAVEMFLEVYSLGFSMWRTLVRDYEVGTPSEQPYYPANLLVHERLDVRPKGQARALQDAKRGDNPENSAVLPSTLRLSLEEVAVEIKEQIQLRHSAYYDDDVVISRVAEFLTGAEVKESVTARPASIRPTPEFWEGLLVANVVLLTIYLWISAAREIPDAFMALFILFSGYVLPFIALAICLLFYFVARRRWPSRLWRWFWILWAIFGLLILISAVGTHLVS
jgi:hypothetical protein